MRRQISTTSALPAAAQRAPARPGLAIALVVAACGGGQTSAPKAVPPPPPDVVDSGRPPDPATPVAKAIEAPVLVPTPLATDPTKTTIHRLSNGMTVYISPDAQVPSVTAWIAVRAGGRHDPEPSTGLAHYLEHMLFKGTTQLGTLDYAKEKPHLDRIAALYASLRTPGAERDKILAEIDAETQKAAAYAVPNELDQLYSRMGISGLNAFTTNDATVYITDVPKNRLAQWARVEVQRYADPVFRLFWPELEAVYEEKNRSLDNPRRRVNEAFMKAMFPRHGYGWSSVLGESEHLKSPAYADMVAYFERYYTPGNMAILLAGDVDASVLPLLEQEFGKFHRPAGDAAPPGEPPAFARRTELSVAVPSNEGVVLGWPLVASTHPDRLALEVMDLLLLDGQSGILARDLLIPQKVANAGSNPTFLREAGYFELTADALAGQSHADLEKLLLGLVDKLQRGEFTETDLATAVLTWELREEQQLESNQGRMYRMFESFTNGEDWADTVSRVARMKAVTRADVMRVAKQYLGPSYLVVKRVKGEAKPPKITKPGITPVNVDPSRQSAFARSILEMPVAPIEPVALRENHDYTRGKLKTGDAITVANTRNGLFSLSYEYDFGRRDDRLACLALEILKVSGAGTRNAEQVARHLHEHGLSVDTSCSKDRSTISVSGSDRNLEVGIALLRDYLTAPVIDDATLQARVATVLTERANALESPQAIAAAANQFARFGEDSEYRVVATNKQLQAATPAQLKKLLARYLDLKRRTTYFGPREHAAALASIELGTGKVATKPRTLKYRKGNVVLVTDQETAQTHLWMVWPRNPANDNDRAAGTLFSEYAGPLLYQEVREARGHAYTVFGTYAAGGKKLDAASVFAYAGVQGDKLHDALDAILETLRKPVDASRLEVAKESIAQSHRVARVPPRAIAPTVLAWDDQGVKSDPRAARVERALAVDGKALETWTKAALGRPAIISVTGNRKLLDEGKLKKLAPVVAAPVNQLFGY
jgi:predicted Zn-dependent peptidase